MNHYLQSLNKITIFIDNQLRTHTFFYALLLSSLLLLLRAESLDFITRSLWGEDGKIFFNEAISQGLKSIFIPYEGYLHTYPRIVALIGIEFPLSLLPYIFFIGWYLSYALALRYIVRFCKENTINIYLVLVFSASMALMPNEGEVYFNITNAHWFLACVAILFFITKSNKSPHPFELIMLTIVGLTGPFVLILLPVFFINLLIIKDFQHKKFAYIIVIFCSAVQLFFILNSERLYETINENYSLIPWFIVLIKTILFGSKHVIALLFWLTFLYAIKINLHQKKQMNYLFILSIAGFIIWLAGMYANQDTLHVLSPVGPGSRYFFTPYILLFLCTIILVNNHRNLAITASILIILICFLDLNRVNRGNLQWEAYTKFSEVNPNLVIPISPIIEEYPGWSMMPHDRYVMNEIKEVPTLINLPSTSIIDISSYCKDISFIGLELDIKDNTKGFVTVYWSSNTKSFSHEKSLRLYYPNGNVTMQFAFKRQPNDIYIKIQDNQTNLNEKIQNVKLYCLL